MASHTILWGDGQGQFLVGVLQLQGSIDQNELFQIDHSLDCPACGLEDQ